VYIDTDIHRDVIRARYILTTTRNCSDSGGGTGSLMYALNGFRVHPPGSTGLGISIRFTCHLGTTVETPSIPLRPNVVGFVAYKFKAVM
jgi:hypothetical protein